MFGGLHQFSEFRNQSRNTDPILSCGIAQTCRINLQLERGAVNGLCADFGDCARLALQFGKRPFDQHHRTHFGGICKQAARIPNGKEFCVIRTIKQRGRHGVNPL